MGQNSIPVGELGKISFGFYLVEDKTGKLGLVKRDQSLDLFQEAQKPFKGRVIPTEMYFESWAAGWGRTQRRKGYTDMPGQQQASCRVKRKKHWLSREKGWASQYCK